jgi:predicted membrane-bound dolichyl-phosphate-mannose-protein mannosyltransferase
VRQLMGQIRRLLAHSRTPLIALAVILALSVVARVAFIGRPCSSPCKTGRDHSLIFDEAYYVNAARVIAGIHPPAGVPYAGAPLGKDPNAEHPQLAKLVMAGGIELFGDNPWGWRLGSVLFGLIAIVAMYLLVRGAGGSRWLAVGAAGVMALDNMMLIHGRIATLDIYAVAPLIAAAALYVRGRPWLAGVVLGLAACMKLVALFLVPALVLFEVIQVLWNWRAPGGRLAVIRGRAIPLVITVACSLVTVIAGVWVLDRLVAAYDPGTHITYAGNPFKHIGHMLSYAEKLKSVPNATGISSTPWQWLLNQKPIDYSRVAVNSSSGAKIVASRAVFAARGEINPFVILLAVPALFAAVAGAWYERDRVAALGAAWCVGTFVPFVIQAQILGRISYLYYMLIVLPGIYLVTARMFSPTRIPRAATVGWVVALLYSLIDLYPVRSLSGH